MHLLMSRRKPKITKKVNFNQGKEDISKINFVVHGDLDLISNILVVIAATADSGTVLL
jgi:hypothetical protein